MGVTGRHDIPFTQLLGFTHEVVKREVEQIYTGRALPHDRQSLYSSPSHGAPMQRTPSTASLPQIEELEEHLDLQEAGAMQDAINMHSTASGEHRWLSPPMFSVGDYPVQPTLPIDELLLMRQQQAQQAAQLPHMRPMLSQAVHRLPEPQQPWQVMLHQQQAQ
jgi:hypothetical protein